MADYRIEEWLVNLPLYAVGEIAEINLSFPYVK